MLMIRVDRAGKVPESGGFRKRGGQRSRSPLGRTTRPVARRACGPMSVAPVARRLERVLIGHLTGPDARDSNV